MVYFPVTTSAGGGVSRRNYETGYTPGREREVLRALGDRVHGPEADTVFHDRRPGGAAYAPGVESVLQGIMRSSVRPETLRQVEAIDVDPESDEGLYNYGDVGSWSPTGKFFLAPRTVHIGTAPIEPLIMHPPERVRERATARALHEIGHAVTMHDPKVAERYIESLPEGAPGSGKGLWLGDDAYREGDQIFGSGTRIRRRAGLTLADIRSAMPSPTAGPFGYSEALAESHAMRHYRPDPRTAKEHVMLPEEASYSTREMINYPDRERYAANTQVARSLVYGRYAPGSPGHDEALITARRALSRWQMGHITS